MTRTTLRHYTESENTTTAKSKDAVVEGGQGLTAERCLRGGTALSTSRLSLTQGTESVHAQPISQDTKKKRWRNSILGTGRTCLTRILGAGSGIERLKTSKKTTTCQVEKSSTALSSLMSRDSEKCGEITETRGSTSSYLSQLTESTTPGAITLTIYSSLHDAIMSRRPGPTKHISAVNNTLTRRSHG